MLERGLEGLLFGIFKERTIGEPPNWYASPSYVRQIQQPGDTFGIRRWIPLTDREIFMMDPAVSDLKRHNATGFDVLRYFYGMNMDDEFIAKQVIFKGGRYNAERVRNIRKDAEDWVGRRIGLIKD